MFASLFLAILVAAPHPGASGHPAVATKVSARPRLTVGDRFDVSFVVKSPHKSLVTGPLADSMGVFAVAEERRRTQAHGDGDVSTYRLSMAGFVPGRHPLPVFHFVVQAGERTDTLQTDTASVTIVPVLSAKMQDINGLAPPESFPNLLLWLIPAGLLLLAALVYLGRRLLRRLRRLQELAQAPLPPWDEALGALDALPWREWLEDGQVKRYYYSLSEILKRYIERRFDFQAVEQTTTEMLASMRAHKTPMRDDVARFFTRSDLVKYSKLVPPADEAASAIGQVREFVLKTKPQEPVAQPATGAPSVAPAGGSA